MNKTPAIVTEDFPEFFEELWGYKPFPWQVRLVQTVVEKGWPEVLDLPTGSGKTAVLEIACFALAMDANQPVEQRCHARRVALVIDRRIVVDQAYERARDICAKLEAARSGVLGRVASALLSLQSSHGSRLPMIAASLRGGTVREDSWSRSPDQPCFLISTVDQVGSRLLFRGYGVSNGMAPVHAGLLGVDCLYLLDEVHLSRPFLQTLKRLSQFSESPLVEKQTLRTPSVVSMSATPGTAESAFRLAQHDFENPVLNARLSARKKATLVSPVKVTSNRQKANEKIAKKCVEQAKAFLKSGAETVAIIVNRVDTARQAAQLAQGLAQQTVLLTGRMRSLDRDDVQRVVMEDLRSGRSRPSARTTLVVSTQAIEVGADFDFDAIVTECASLDALRQRFGRLDRRGELKDSAQAAIIVGDAHIREGEEDPIYGTSIATTWNWLSKHSEDGVVDVGIVAQREREPFPEGAVVAARRAPELLPAYLDLWAQTSPRPAIEPDIPVFLHGAEKGAPQAQVLWRGDISDELLDMAIGEDLAQREATITALEALFELCPPSALESVGLPLWAARDWMEQLGQDEFAQGFAELSDAEGATDPTANEKQGSSAKSAGKDFCAPFVVFYAGSMSVSNRLADLRPGSVVVLPASRGGISEATKNWDPTAREPVRDLGDRAQLIQRGRAIVRWGALDQEKRQALHGRVDQDELETGGEHALRDAFTDWAGDLEHNSSEDSWLALAADWISSSSKSRMLEVTRPLAEMEAHGSPDSETSSPGWKPWYVSVRYDKVSSDRMRHATGLSLGSSATPPGPGDRASFTNRKVPLFKHLEGVQGYSGTFAEQVGLAHEFVNDLRLAGLLHDIGKSDPRFQTMLLGGDPVDAMHSEELLAKSDMPFFDLARRRRAQALSGYPKGTRHEIMSLALIENNTTFREMANDWELVLHLVASHHGYCRPFAPILKDPNPVPVEVQFREECLSHSSDNKLDRLDSGVSKRFWRLVRRYGWHGLAYLEAILRLADHRRSEFEQKEESAG